MTETKQKYICAWHLYCTHRAHHEPNPEDCTVGGVLCSRLKLIPVTAPDSWDKMVEYDAALKKDIVSYQKLVDTECESGNYRSVLRRWNAARSSRIRRLPFSKRNATKRTILSNLT